MTQSSKTPHNILAKNVNVGDRIYLDGDHYEVGAVHKRGGGYVSFDLVGGTEVYRLLYATVTIML